MGAPPWWVQRWLKANFPDFPQVQYYAMDYYKRNPVQLDTQTDWRNKTDHPVDSGNPRNPKSNKEASDDYKKKKNNPMLPLPEEWPKPSRLSASNETEEPSEASNFMASLDEKLNKKNNITATGA
jgi:hypothetical protein